MLLSLFFSAAIAGPPAVPAGYAEIHQEHDCTLYAGPKDAAGVAPVFVSCAWPELSVDKLDALLSNWPAHATYFSAVAECNCEPAAGGASLCHQRNVASGISDREIDILMSRSPVDGGWRYSWTPAPTQRGALEGNVQAVKSEGAWTVTANPAGGVWATYELYYDAGGSVPSWVVRWFQGSGIAALVGELRAYAAN